MSISKRLRFEVFKRDSFTCQYCGAKPPDTVLEVDHVHPRSLGGLDTMDNLKTACWACNRGKAHVPILPLPRIYTLRGGPCDGQTYELKLDTDLPVVWVMQRHDGELGFFEDMFIDEEKDGDWNGQRIRFGHPGYGIEKQPRSGAVMDFSMGPWNENPRPVLLGVYWYHNVPRPDGVNPFILTWGDLEEVIVELTA